MKRLQHVETRAGLQRETNQLFDRFVGRGGPRASTARRQQLEADRAAVEQELKALEGKRDPEHLQ